MLDYLAYTACGIAGVLFHSVVKYDSLQKTARAANVPFGVKNYLKEDAASLVASLLSVGIWLLVFAEAVDKYTALTGWARLSFVLMGAIGSYLIQYFFSQAQKRIMSVIDEKTNKADGIEKPQS